MYNNITTLVGLAPSNIGVPHAIEGTADNLPGITVHIITVAVDGGVGLDEALDSDRETLRISSWEENLGSIRLY